jgi:uncharacterized protein with FMN-binding domain
MSNASPSDSKETPLRRPLTIVLVAATLGTSAANAATALAGAKTTTAKNKVVTRKVTGQAYDADRWGTVTVVLTVRTTSANGKKSNRVLDLGGSYSYHTDRSQYIMSQSLPILRQEYLQAKSANVQMVSGATYTSQAFLQSLQSALSRV